MEDRDSKNTIRPADEKKKLWQRFCKSGCIADYLAYSCFCADSRNNGNR